MTNAWRFCCARCGSVVVIKRREGHWACNGRSSHHTTPAVYDLRENEWHHTQKKTKTRPSYLETTRPFKSWPGGGL